MAPERSPKRQKTHSDSGSQSKAASPNQVPLPSDATIPNLATSPDLSDKQPQRSSWYSTWSRKAPPIAQVARESIKSASSVASEVASSVKDVSSSARSIRSPSLAMTLGKGRPSRASLADATTTMVHAEANSPAGKTTKSLSTSSTDIPAPQNPTAKIENSPVKVQDESKTDPQPSQKDTEVKEVDKDAQMSRSSWIGWLSRAEETAANPAKQEEGSTPGTSPPEEPANSTATQPSMVQIPSPSPVTTSSVNEGPGSRRSWLPIWNSESTSKAEPTHPPGHNLIEPSNLSNSSTGSKEGTVEPVQASSVSQTQPESQTSVIAAPPPLPHDGNKASAWAFWSRDRKANDSSTSVDRPREGEIAVSNTPSQNQPRRTSISVPKETSDLKPDSKKPDAKNSEMKKLEAKKSIAKDKSTDSTAVKAADTPPTKTPSKVETKPEANVTKAESSNATAVVVEPSENKKPASIKSTKPAHNLLLPTVHSTLKLPESPSLLLRLASLLYASKEPDLSHLSLVKDPPRIKNALAIGVHGYFPAPLIRSVLGQPTGTSIKFADMAAKSIKRFTSAKGYECQVKTAALEGEGKIAERLELLWKLLLNWIEEIRNSDFIMIACHSQGVPVAIMLVAKLIQFGCVGSARVCICAMAGVNMGPFPEYKSRWIGGSAGELFEFSDSSSRVSGDYLAALDVVLKFGVRLTFIGSIDDQLVSLESSIYSPLSHPHIFRAVSIDSRVHAPNFLSHLVGFALKLRNIGVQDHGLIRELSSPLAGSLYTGEGHSRIYEDDAVYDLAVSFAMETNELVGIPVQQKAVAAGGNNPYILPFAMRGMLEEDFVKNELQSEASDLLKEFDEWKPTSKVLKDVKFRLEGIRSKL